MMKKLTLFTLTLGIFFISFGQMKYGIKGGITQSFVKEGWQQPDTKNALKTGFQVGVFIERSVFKNIYLRPSVQLTQKGYKSVVGNPEGPFYWNRDLSTTYLELPLDVLYKFQINKISNLFFGSGPVVSYGIYGKLKATFATIDNTQQLHNQSSTDNKIFKNNTDCRLDFGWNFLAGLQHRRMILNTGYNHGISNVIKDANQSLKNRNFSLTFGYLIQN